MLQTEAYVAGRLSVNAKVKDFNTDPRLPRVTARFQCGRTARRRPFLLTHVSHMLSGRDTAHSWSVSWPLWRMSLSAKRYFVESMRARQQRQLMTASATARAAHPQPAFDRAQHDRMANAIRALAMDAVEAANSGHPGLPMGAADVATVLFTRFLKFDPADTAWSDRDRFVLSAGHGSMLIYALLYLL